jgi:hypothetical protein
MRRLFIDCANARSGNKPYAAIRPLAKVDPSRVLGSTGQKSPETQTCLVFQNCILVRGRLTMAKNQRTHPNVQHEPSSVLRNVALVVLPFVSLQRSVLDLVKTGIEKAVLLRPVQNMLLSEIQALMIILDPDRKLRGQLDVEFETRTKELLDEITDKVTSGSLRLVQAQQAAADRLIDLLKTLKDAPRRKRAEEA